MIKQIETKEPENSIKAVNLKDIFVMPIQPINNGRFVPNRIVQMLLNTHPSIDLNSIALGDFMEQERMQFAQLIGYSLGGFSELSCVDDETYEAASTIAEEGISEAEARNKALRSQISSVKKGLKIATCAIFEIHPDDLDK